MRNGMRAGRARMNDARVNELVERDHRRCWLLYLSPSLFLSLVPFSFLSLSFSPSVLLVAKSRPRWWNFGASSLLDATLFRARARRCVLARQELLACVRVVCGMGIYMAKYDSVSRVLVWRRISIG